MWVMAALIILMAGCSSASGVALDHLARPAAPHVEAFRFVATHHTPQPPIAERRGYHFVLAAEEPSSDVVYGCGINGELAAFRSTAHELELLENTIASDLMQSRAMLWYNKQLVVRVQ